MDLMKHERYFWDQNINYIAGIDEAGRGPLCGPVVAACVIFDKNISIGGINDSKKLSPKKRKELYIKIKENAIDLSYGIANENEIDEINILQATFLAMKRAVENLKVKPNILLIDGPHSNFKLIKTKNIIRGDSESISIAAASIIAKVIRDNLMQEYDKIFPNYGFIKNKGYGTKLHIDALNDFKATPIHRKSFKIVKENLPNYSYFKKNKMFDILGKKLVAVKFIKKMFLLDQKNLFLKRLDDYIDYIFYNNEQKSYIKVISIESDKITSNSKKNISNISLYLNEIKNSINEKDLTKKVIFNVILVEFKPKNKPSFKILYDEKVH